MRSLDRADSLVTAPKELSKYKLDLVGVQEVSDIELTGEHTFSCGKGNESHELGTVSFIVHNQWLVEGCSKLLHRRKQAKMQWLQDPSTINWGNLNNVRLEASRYFRNKKREFLKDKINELATNSKNKNIRDLYRGIN
jgi:hypothetical protein